LNSADLQNYSGGCIAALHAVEPCSVTDPARECSSSGNVLHAVRTAAATMMILTLLALTLPLRGFGRAASH
jgi:hypothetical protein